MRKAATLYCHAAHYRCEHCGAEVCALGTGACIGKDGRRRKEHGPLVPLAPKGKEHEAPQ